MYIYLDTAPLDCVLTVEEMLTTYRIHLNFSHTSVPSEPKHINISAPLMPFIFSVISRENSGFSLFLSLASVLCWETVAEWINVVSEGKLPGTQAPAL